MRYWLSRYVEAEKAGKSTLIVSPTHAEAKEKPSVFATNFVSGGNWKMMGRRSHSCVPSI